MLIFFMWYYLVIAGPVVIKDFSCLEIFPNYSLSTLTEALLKSLSACLTSCLSVDLLWNITVMMTSFSPQHAS